VVPIKSNQQRGYLLQCYESGHINKVFVSVLLSRKVGKEYMNGLNLNDRLKCLTIIDTEKIMGIYFYEHGQRKFKAHLTESISNREQLHLQGYKVIYNEFEKIEYKILPLEIKNDLNRLIFQSFMANGKSVNNLYYEYEWSILKRFDTTKNEASPIIENTIPIENIEQVVGTPIVKSISQNSTVKIKYLNKDKELTIQLVDYETKGNERYEGVQKIYYRSPITALIIGKSEGDIVRLGNSEYYVKILEIK
jgi:hypothetical protein